MCGYDRYTWLRSQDIYGKSAILKEMTFYKSRPLSEVLPKLSQPFPKPKHEVRRFGGVLKLSICFYKIYAKSIINLIDSITLNTELNQESEQGKLCLMQIYFHATFLINSQHTQRGLFHFVQRFPFVRLDQGFTPDTPKTIQNKNRRFSFCIVSFQKLIKWKSYVFYYGNA